MGRVRFAVGELLLLLGASGVGGRGVGGVGTRVGGELAAAEALERELGRGKKALSGDNGGRPAQWFTKLLPLSDGWEGGAAAFRSSSVCPSPEEGAAVRTQKHGPPTWCRHSAVGRDA